MIESFADTDTEDLFRGEAPKRFATDVRKRMVQKLQLIDAACRPEDLRIPPGNRLEALSGDRSGLYSIRVNDRWRICFRFKNGNAYDVEIVDYH
mgnify:CR=1 FL=1